MANTYPTTQFPLGSTEVKVLFNNASNFDEAMNSELPSWYDRFNKRRETWAGMQKLVTDFLEAMGFEATHLVYVDGTPLTVLRPTQLIDRAGSVYKVKMPASFPVNLTGTWATDQLLLVDVGDASLRMALAAVGGVFLVGDADTTVDSIVDLQTVEQRTDRTYSVTGFMAASFVGGGRYRYDPGTAKALHDGRNVISPTVPWNGSTATLAAFLAATGETAPGTNGAFVREVTEPVRLPELGATVTQATASIAKMLSTGGLKEIPDGVWRMPTQVVRDFSGDPGFPNTNEPSGRFVLKGDSISNSLLQFDGPGYAFVLKGGLDIPTGQNVLTQTELSQFSLKPSGALASCDGIQMVNQAYVSIKDLNVEYCNIGIDLNSTITSKLDNVFLRSNEIGLQLRGAGFSMPNALAMGRITAQENRFAGILANRIGGGVKIDGATIEGNGTMGAAGTGGIIGNIDGVNGSATLQLSNVYFEGNKGDADLLLENISAFTVTVILIGCNFHRISPTNYVTNNIKLSNTGGGKIRLIMIGCAFMTAGTYVASAGRPFISRDQGSEVIDIGCSYNEQVSLNHSINASVTSVGRVNADGTAATGMPFGQTSAKIGTGTYTVTSTVGWGVDVNGYVASATSTDGSARIVQRIVQDTATQFTVVITDASGAAADGSFNFSSTRIS